MMSCARLAGQILSFYLVFVSPKMDNFLDQKSWFSIGFIKFLCAFRDHFLASGGSLRVSLMSCAHDIRLTDVPPPSADVISQDAAVKLAAQNVVYT